MVFCSTDREILVHRRDLIANRQDGIDGAHVASLQHKVPSTLLNELCRCHCGAGHKQRRERKEA
jgi:hypothetical protein